MITVGDWLFNTPTGVVLLIVLALAWTAWYASTCIQPKSERRPMNRQSARVQSLKTWREQMVEPTQIVSEQQSREIHAIVRGNDRGAA